MQQATRGISTRTTTIGGIQTLLAQLKSRVKIPFEPAFLAAGLVFEVIGGQVAKASSSVSLPIAASLLDVLDLAIEVP